MSLPRSAEHLSKTAPVLAYIGLGANLGDLALTLRQALQALAGLPGSRLHAVSSAYRSAPIDAGGPDYLNAAAALETHLSPEQLLSALQAIELQHGRERPFVNAPRTLDLDLLLYGHQTIATSTLTVPHPRLGERAFVLRPLLELSAELQVPGWGDLKDLLPQVEEQRIERLPLSLMPP